MRTEKLSINKVCMVVCAAFFLLSIVMPVTIYFLTQNVLALCCGLLYAVFVAGCMVAFLAFVRRKLTLFSDALCKLLDDMMSADQRKKTCFIKSSTGFPGSTKCCGKAKAVLQRNGPTCRN